MAKRPANKRRKLKIARYMTEAGARGYADELRAVWPERTFSVGLHPYEAFRYTVTTMQGGRLVYVGERPVGGPGNIASIEEHVQ